MLVGQAKLTVDAAIPQAEDKLGGSLRTCQYHGQNRPRNVQKIAADFDLVITTYQTLSSDFRLDVSEDGAGFKPLGAIHWHRIILDEVTSTCCLSLTPFVEEPICPSTAAEVH